MTAERTSLDEFIKARRIALASEWAPSNPNMDDSDRMNHWKCVLKAGRKRMTLYFSKGIGHNGTEPNATEVLDCLASDSAGVENAGSFEAFCSEYGYDTDSRKAEKTWQSCQEQAERLKSLLGDEAYKQLLWETERL